MTQFGLVNPAVTSLYTNATFPSAYAAMNDFMSTFIFQCAGRRTAKYINSVTPVYAYSFNYKPTQSRYTLPGHGQELPFIFGAGNVISLWLNITQTELETSMTNVLQTMILRFVYNGNPNLPAPSAVEAKLATNLNDVGSWSPYSTSADMFYNIDANQTTYSFGMGPHKHAVCAYWDQAIPIITPVVQPRTAPCLNNACMSSISGNTCVDQMNGNRVCSCQAPGYTSGTGNTCVQTPSSSGTTNSTTSSGTRETSQSAISLVLAMAMALVGIYRSS